MDSVNHFRTISPEDRDYCDDSITQEEVLKAIKNLKNNKSPGCDGITAELYKMFNDLLTFLRELTERSSSNNYDAGCHHIDSKTRQGQKLSRELAPYFSPK